RRWIMAKAKDEIEVKSKEPGVPELVLEELKKTPGVTVQMMGSVARVFKGGKPIASMQTNKTLFMRLLKYKPGMPTNKKLLKFIKTYQVGCMFSVAPHDLNYK